MTLGPIDVQQKTFGTALRGYDLDEVDDFLDEVVTTLKDYEQRIREAEDRAAELRSRLEEQGDAESVISRALVAAQRSADEIVAGAREEADRIRAEAHREAGELEAQRERERELVSVEIARLREAVRDLRERVFALADSVSEDLETMDSAIDAAAAGTGLAEEPDDTVHAGDVADEASDEPPVAVREPEPEPDAGPEPADLGDAWLAGGDDLAAPAEPADGAGEEASPTGDHDLDEEFFIDPGVDDEESFAGDRARRPWERD